MTKMTPAQRALLQQLQEPDRYINGLPLGEIRGTAATKTVAGLERRGVAVVMADRLYAKTTETAVDTIPKEVRALSDNQLTARLSDTEDRLAKAERDYLSARQRRRDSQELLKHLRAEKYYRS